MNRYGLADGFLRGAELGFGLARQKKRDALEEERLGLDKALRLRQMQSYDLQDETNRFRLDQMKTEAGREDDDYQRQQNLRQIEAWDYLLQNGKDDGQLAGVYNEMGQYQPWLQGRNLADAKFSGFEMNNMGKGEPGLVTFIEGKDKATGQVRRGVATERASSDPDDPVKVMPTNQIVRMIQDLANQGDALGNAEHAARLRQHALSLIQAEKVRLGGKASEPRDQWGEIQYRDDVGTFVRNQKDGSVQVLTTPNKLGYGARNGRGGRGGGRNDNGFMDDLHKRLQSELGDDPDRQIDNSALRTLGTSMAESLELEYPGAIPPGVYVQAVKDAGSGLVLSMDDAIKQVQANNAGGWFDKTPDADDPRVQEQAARLIEENRAIFADRFQKNLFGSRGGSSYTGGDGGSPDAAQPPQAQGGGGQDYSLDSEVEKIVSNAARKGQTVTREQAAEWLVTQFPDRFGDSGADPEQDVKQGPKSWADIQEQARARSLSSRIARAADGVKGAAADLGDKSNKFFAKKAFQKLIKSGYSPLLGSTSRDEPPAVEALAGLLPVLEGSDRDQAASLLIELYPSDPRAIKALQSVGFVE